MTTERRRIRKRAALQLGRKRAAFVARGNAERLSSEKNLGPFVPPTVASRSPYLPPARSRARRKESAATRYEGLAHRYAVYVTFARCKCVVPHAISWSNGPWSRASYSHNHASSSSCSCTDNTKRIERLSKRRIGSARGCARDSGESSEISKRINAREENGSCHTHTRTRRNSRHCFMLLCNYRKKIERC